MDPSVTNSVVSLRARFRRFLISVPRLEKARRVSVESLYNHLSRPPDNKIQVILAEFPVDADYPVDNVRNYRKSIKTRRLRPRWRIRGKHSPKCPRRSVDTQHTVDSEYLVSMSQSLLDDRPPDYNDDSSSTDPGLHVFLKQLGECAGGDASWEVRYAAVECVDSVVHSQSGEAGDCTDHPPITCHIQPAQPSTSEDYFQNFYHTLEPFILGPGSSPGAQAPDFVTADIWDNLFPDTADDDAGDAGYMPDSAGVSTGIAVNRRHDHDQHSPPPPPTQTATEGCNSSKRLFQATPLLGPQTRNSFSTPVLAAAGTWDIDELHKSTNLQPTPETEPREALVHDLLNFDHQFQDGNAAAFTAAWRPPKSGDLESAGIKKYSNNSTESGQSSSYGAALSSQGSSSVNHNFPLKRGRHEEDPNKRKKKKKDEQPRNPPGPPMGEEEKFPCPFKDGGPTGSDKVVKACNTDFPNQSKLKEHIRRAHFKHLQCPHNGCTFCAGTPFEVNRHQGTNHPSPQPPLPPILQTTDLDSFYRNQALGSKKLTWEMISRICFSTDIQGLLKSLSNELNGESNFGCGRDEIGDEGDDEVPSPASNDEINKSDESTFTDISVGLLVGDEEHPNFADGYNTSPPSDESRNEVPQSDNGYEMQKARLFINKKFEEMRCKLIPDIFAYLGSPEKIGFGEEINAVFERLYQANHDILTKFNGYYDPHTDHAPPTPQLTHTQLSAPNTVHEYELSPSLSQIYFNLPYLGQLAGPGTGAPVCSGEGDSATAQDSTQSPESWVEELLLELALPSGGVGVCFPEDSTHWVPW